MRSIAGGFRYVRTQPVVLGFMLVDVNAMVFGMPMALFPAIATHVYGDKTLVGYMLRGSVRRRARSSLASGWIPHVRRQGLAVAIAASALGRRDRRFRIHRDALARARGCWRSPARPTTSAPSSARRSC
jgi:hypothetical protein